MIEVTIHKKFAQLTAGTGFGVLRILSCPRYQSMSSRSCDERLYECYLLLLGEESVRGVLTWKIAYVARWRRALAFGASDQRAT